MGCLIRRERNVPRSEFMLFHQPLHFLKCQIFVLVKIDDDLLEGIPAVCRQACGRGSSRVFHYHEVNGCE